MRISGIPRSWNRDHILDVLGTLDPTFSTDKSSQSLSVFPACHGDRQVALCEVDTSASLIRTVHKVHKGLSRVTAGEDNIQLDLDTQFYDMTPLNAPGEVVADVVAVTGLAGHAFGSWRSRDTGKMWLKDFLSEDVSGVRIMTYGYNSSLVGGTVEHNFLEYRKHFIHSLLNARHGVKVCDVTFWQATFLGQRG